MECTALRPRQSQESNRDIMCCIWLSDILLYSNPPPKYIYIQEQKTGYYHFKVGICSTYRLVAMTGWFQQISRGPQDRSLSGPAGGVK